MKGTIRSIIGSITIILIITGIVAFTGEDEEVGNTAIQNQTQNKPMRRQMPTDTQDNATKPLINDQTDIQPDAQADVNTPINTDSEKIQQAPPEALEACTDLKEGDKCTFMSDNEICMNIQDQLACVPDRFN